MTPSFTMFVGCIGRETLFRTIDSYIAQDRSPDDRLLLVMNADEAPAGVRRAHRYLQTCGEPSVRLLLCDGVGYFNKMNWASFQIPIETTHVLPMIGDDDILVRDAFARLRPACTADLERVVLFRFLAPFRRVLWDAPRMRISCISGHCIAVPRRYWPVPFSTRDYKEVDYDWMLAVLARQQVERRIDPLWLDAVLVVARPDAMTAAQGWS